MHATPGTVTITGTSRGKVSNHRHGYCQRGAVPVPESRKGLEGSGSEGR